jgi:hypothetical protein
MLTSNKKWFNKLLNPFLISAIIALLLFILRWDYGYDDPYITYRYSSNLSQGLGFVYNLGEHVLSTTTPLYAMLLAVLSVTGLSIPIISNLISALSLALGGYLLWQLGRYWDLPYFGWVGLLCYPMSSLLISTFGSEMPFYLMLNLAAIVMYVTKRYHTMAVLLALAVLTRADGIVAAGAIALFILWKERPIPWKALITFALVLAPWFLFSWVYFSSIFPATLAAKQLQGQMEISRSFFDGLLSQVRNLILISKIGLFIPIYILGFVAIVSKYNRALIAIFWAVLYNIGYIVLGVSSYFWYFAPTVAMMCIIMGLGVNFLFDILQSFTKLKIARYIAIAGVTLCVFYQYSAIPSLLSQPEPRQNIYRHVGLWLNNNTPTKASIGTLEIGVIGFYAERRMIDFAGLLQPMVTKQIGPTTTYQDTAIWAINAYKPDYLVLQRQLFPELENLKRVQDICNVIQTFEEPGYPYPIDIYKCT